MKGFILKPHEARQLAEGKPVVIWRVMKPQPQRFSRGIQSLLADIKRVKDDQATPQTREGA